MKKHLLVTVSLLTFLLVLVSALPVQAEESSYRTKKVVSVVYDDSGSMSQYGLKNWAYADYAMQAFIALLDKNDELYITYTSNPGVSESYPDLSANRQSYVDSIRSHWGESWTPDQTMETAFNTLLSHQSSDSNVEYSLVIITDGSFNTDAQELFSQEDLNERVSRYASTKLNNGSSLNVIFFGIGDQAVVPAQTENLEIYTATSDTLTDTLFDIADATSGRYRFADNQISKDKDGVFKIDASVPMLNLGVLVQNSGAQIQSVTDSSGTKLSVDQTTTLSYPSHDGAETDESLKGSAMIITSNSGNIPKGEISIKFTEDVDPAFVRIMYEPALNVDVRITRNGKTVQDPANLREGDHIDIQADIVETGTNNVIDPDSLPSDIKYSLSYETGTQSLNATDQMELKDITVENAQTKIRATAVLNDVFNIEKTMEFEPKAPVVYGLTVSQSDNIDHMTLDKLEDNNEYVEFTITADGEPVSESEARDMAFSVETDREFPYETVYNTDNGHYYVKPVYKWPVWFTSKAGPLKITGTLSDSIQADTTVTFDDASLLYYLKDLLLGPLLLLFFFFLIYRYFRKKRFDKKTYIYEGDFRDDGDGRKLKCRETKAAFIANGRRLDKFSIWSLTPFDNRVKIDGLVFYPCRTPGLISIKAGGKDTADWHKSGSVDWQGFGSRRGFYQISMPDKEPVLQPGEKFIYIEINSSLVIPCGRYYQVYYYSNELTENGEAE